MDEKKIVTWEMFKKYHEHLVGVIDEGDGAILEDLTSEEEAVEEEE
jgi:hypothetical protein